MGKNQNVIFFFSDQQRWDTVGCYGQKLDITPNLDKMAAEGVRFENAFTCQPVCGPARSCLQTGVYATETGCYRNSIALPLNEKTIASYFNEAGYETAYVGKWHLASTDKEIDFATKAVPPERRGGWKDYWVASDVLEFTSDGYSGHMFDGDMNKKEFKGFRADCTTDFALEYLDKKYSGEIGDKDKPFVLFISYIEPHHQNNHHRVEGPLDSKKKFSSYQVPEDLKETKGDWKENYPDYLGCCNSLDYNLGRLREKLNNIGIAKDTVIIYTSDHGCHFKTRNNEYKRSCHEDAIRVPMIACGPGFKGGKVVKQLVSLIDIPPTLLTAAGIEVPKRMKGRPTQGLVDGTAENWPQEVFLQISESQVGRAIRTKKWKYSVSAPHKDKWNDSFSDVYCEEYLYDLENDPYEKNNLVNNSDYKVVRDELTVILKRRIVEAGETEPKIMTKEEFSNGHSCK